MTPRLVHSLGRSVIGRARILNVDGRAARSAYHHRCDQGWW